MTTCAKPTGNIVKTNQDNFVFRSPLTGAELSASFTRFPEQFRAAVGGRSHLTPTDDFVGTLKATEPADGRHHHRAHRASSCC